jgi:zinc transport system permease protein
MAAFGAVAGAFVGAPLVPGALAAAALAAIVKGRLQRAGNDSYALLLLLGWSGTLLAASNATRGEDLGHAVVDGQLYFTGWTHFRTVALIAGIVAVALPWLSPRLLIARLFPDHWSANGVSAWRYHVTFDLLAAATLAIAATSIGVMATFGFVFVAPWLTFRRARGWRHALVWSCALSVAGYVVGFAAAILLNQPFGPTAVASLFLVAAIYTLLARVGRQRPREACRSRDWEGAQDEAPS